MTLLAVPTLEDEAADCIRRDMLPVNPHRCPDGEGISIAINLRNLLDCRLDAGNSGGSLFLVGIRNLSVDDVIVALDLRNQAYDRYSAAIAAR